ncbi:Small conductance calcium-activated potassium channel protein [Pseudolycoriella hygida]|uniref:Small conductance calcium-activated potassium channel protein n=1 Tax=Pseudolycoriella hygida TaxID=35572 RepID=A0A9Q0MN99_9DIPT|nr:Small conductance calcium-activated potassium channel protein [Pseudolycoriella hygida]
MNGMYVSWDSIAVHLRRFSIPSSNRVFEQNVTEDAPKCTATNSGYGSGDDVTETASLLVPTTSNHNIVTASTSPLCQSKMTSINGPTTSKPVLMRQDRTSTYLTSPNLSQTHGCSEESGPSIEDSELNPIATSITDIDVQYRLETPVISISNAGQGGHRSSVSGYQLSPHMRCRACRSCERRASTTPVSSLHLARSVSRESVRSNVIHLSPISPNMQYKHIPPPVLITGSPNSGSRIIRQSSQPEASSICCGGHSNTCMHPQSVSLRQISDKREASEGIAGIAADSLRINGAMRPFKQWLILVQFIFAFEFVVILHYSYSKNSIAAETYSEKAIVMCYKSVPQFCLSASNLSCFDRVEKAALYYTKFCAKS